MAKKKKKKAKIKPKPKPKPKPEPEPEIELDDGDLELGGDIELDVSDEELNTGLDSGPNVQLDVELLTAMLRSKDDLMAIHHAGLHPTMLGDPNLRPVFREVLTFYQKHGFPMTPEIFQDHNPDIGLLSNPRSVKEIVYDLSLDAKRRAIVDAERDIQTLIDPELGGNPHKPENLDNVFEVYRDSVRRFNYMFTRSTDRIETFGDGRDLIDAYNARTKGIVNGAPICFSLIAEDISSWEYGHLSGFIARPGARKTFLMIYMICMAVIMSDVKAFVHSSEMTSLELKERMTAMLAGLNYTRYMRGTLTKVEKQNLKKFLLKSEAQEKLDANLHVAGPTAVMDVPSIEIECAERDIKLIGLDNTVTLDAEGEAHLKVQNLMYDMKYMAIRLGAHVLFTSHQNRTGGRGMQGVAYGDAINTWSSNLFNMQLKRHIIDIASFKVRSGRGNMSYKVKLDLDAGEVKQLSKRELHRSQNEKAAEFGRI